MDLVLWRHAEAVDKGDPTEDLARPLTHKGERQAERMASWLNRRLPDSTRILVSPAVRCEQTAAALGRKFKIRPELAPDAPPQAVLDVAGWPQGTRAVLIVGHQPTLGLTAALALTGDTVAWSMRKGGLWWFRYRSQDEDGKVLLLSVQSPDCL